jgi:Thaumarchaeal output domain 1
MKEIGSRIGELDATTAADGAGEAAEERRLNLLRRISLAGGTIVPHPNPHAVHGYTYVTLGDDVERDLGILARQNYLEERFFDRVSLCPKCDSHHLNVREICPGCRKAHLTKEGLLHHFRCGYVGIPAEFLSNENGSYLCPKCNQRMHHVGRQFDRLGKAFTCRSCGLISETPPVEAVCLACKACTPADDLVSTEVFSYIVTSRGATAVRHGSLLDGDEELVSIADAPVYRRTVIIEFLDHEIKRLQHLKTGFSLLLAEYEAAAIEPGGDDSPRQWLTRLRLCLREIDLIGQLADALYVVILPQTRRREAEALRQRILAELGAKSPLILSTVEITEPRQLAQVLAGRNTLDRSS